VKIALGIVGILGSLALGGYALVVWVVTASTGAPSADQAFFVRGIGITATVLLVASVALTLSAARSRPRD
jgi:hypothetical protein